MAPKPNIVTTQAMDGSLFSPLKHIAIACIHFHPKFCPLNIPASYVSPHFSPAIGARPSPQGKSGEKQFHPIEKQVKMGLFLLGALNERSPFGGQPRLCDPKQNKCASAIHQRSQRNPSACNSVTIAPLLGSHNDCGQFVCLRRHDERIAGSSISRLEPIGPLIAP